MQSHQRQHRSTRAAHFYPDHHSNCHKHGYIYRHANRHPDGDSDQYTHRHRYVHSRTKLYSDCDVNGDAD